MVGCGDVQSRAIRRRGFFFPCGTHTEVHSLREVGMLGGLLGGLQQGGLQQGGLQQGGLQQGGLLQPIGARRLSNARR